MIISSLSMLAVSEPIIFIRILGTAAFIGFLAIKLVLPFFAKR